MKNGYKFVTTQKD